MGYIHHSISSTISIVICYFLQALRLFFFVPCQHRITLAIRKSRLSLKVAFVQQFPEPSGHP